MVFVEIYRPRREDRDGESLDEFLEKIRRREIEEAKWVDLRKYLLKQQLEVKRLEEELRRYYSKESAAEAVGVTREEIEAARMLSDLGDEDKRKILQTLAMIKAVSGQGGGGGNIWALVPLLMAHSSPQPQPSQPDIGQLMVSLTQAMKNLRELSSPQNQEQGSFQQVYETVIKPLTDQVKTLTELVYREKIAQLEKEIEELKQRPSLAQELEMKVEELNRLRSLFGGPSTTNIELEKLRLEQDRWFKEQQLKLQREALEREKEKEKWELLLGAVEKWAPLIDRIGSKIRGGVGRPVGAQQPRQVQAYTIPCIECMREGRETYVEVPLNPDGTLPEEVTCPVCKRKIRPRQA